ncbi:MAG: hypothetical protein ACRCXM_16525 [Beijerinckiaceae bacterium]
MSSMNMLFLFSAVGAVPLSVMVMAVFKSAANPQDNGDPLPGGGAW